MTRPRGMPPTPSARSRETEPVEMAAMSWTSGSSTPSRITEPLPNCFSMAETASSIAFSLSAFATRPSSGITVRLYRSVFRLARWHEGLTSMLLALLIAASGYSGLQAFATGDAGEARSSGWEGKVHFTHDPPRKSGGADGAIHVSGARVRIEEPTPVGLTVILSADRKLRLLFPERKQFMEVDATEAALATVPPLSFAGL